MHVFLLCYNESALLPHTVKHYKTYLPNCHITIYDNESTDNSVQIAKDLGCSVVSWNSNNEINDFLYIQIKNNCWKPIKSGWVIVADMDELLCVTEEQLMNEKLAGTTILEVHGYNMIGESKTEDLSDIDFKQVTLNHPWPPENKKLCFLREKITEMNYECGAHNCKPKGHVKYSKKIYINKHFHHVGLLHYIAKIKKSSARALSMQKKGMATHYISDTDQITMNYNNTLLLAMKNLKLD